MAKTELMSYRITERRRQWIDELAGMLGLDPTKRGDGAQVLDYALKRTIAEERARAAQPAAVAAGGGRR